ncbi:MAG: class I SAM-dependent rRNA methyltransferase [Chlorobiales bacterium]|nr:class I SAM-dependent rRNA methyltransferase [Chlorobiales bacterium]
MAGSIPTLILKGPGVRPLTKGHLWVYSGAVNRVVGRAKAGQVVRLADGAKKFLAWAWYSPDSRIRARILSRRPEEEFKDGWWAGRLDRARAGRRVLEEDPETEAFRLCNSEADGLPGLTIDIYGRAAVVQAMTPGAEEIKKGVALWLKERMGVEPVLERDDGQSRRLEGLPRSGGLLLGTEPKEPLTILEGGMKFQVDLVEGQKTGWYLDQRVNRGLAAAFAGGKHVLDCFSYSGGFSARALAAGARSSTLVDSSARALRGAKANLELNGLADRASLVQGNVFEILRQYRDAGRRFGLIILDPPKLAPTRAQASKAGRAYKDINLLALKLLEPQGVLATFSCSAGVEPAFFQEIVHWAALDAGVGLQILARLSQPEDHPILLGMPETEYLKGLICRPL